MTEIVRQTPVKSDTVDLLVSTLRVEAGYYDTVILDNHSDQRHAGKRLAGHESEGRTYGPYIIRVTNERATTHEEAMDNHREALYAARTETPA